MAQLSNRSLDYHRKRFVFSFSLVSYYNLYIHKEHSENKISNQKVLDPSP